MYPRNEKEEKEFEELASETAEFSMMNVARLMRGHKPWTKEQFRKWRDSSRHP